MSGGVCFCKDGWHFHAKRRRKDATGGFCRWTAQLLHSWMSLHLFFFVVASLVKRCCVPTLRQRRAANAAPRANWRKTPSQRRRPGRPDCNSRFVPSPTSFFSSSSSQAGGFMRIEEPFLSVALGDRRTTGKKKSWQNSLKEPPICKFNIHQLDHGILRCCTNVLCDCSNTNK